MKELSFVFLMFLIAGLMFATIIVVGWGLIEGNSGAMAAAFGAVTVYLIFGKR